MVETMGENTDYLQKSLASRYPSTQFKLYNYGIGGQNVEQGLSRFPSPFNYKTRNYPPLSEIHPDILIVGSFSYNPFAEHDRTKHSRLLREMVNQARGVSGRVYLLAEIAPLKDGFGQGVGGINWPEDKATTQAVHIIEQLDDSVTVAKTENVPLINAYQSSKVNGNYGNKIYVATHDGIHPSIEGHVFMANLIASLLSF
jgi:lysophospholipase L1-like esterase